MKIKNKPTSTAERCENQAEKRSSCYGTLVSWLTELKACFSSSPLESQVAPAHDPQGTWYSDRWFLADHQLHQGDSKQPGKC